MSLNKCTMLFRFVLLFCFCSTILLFGIFLFSGVSPPHVFLTRFTINASLSFRNALVSSGNKTVTKVDYPVPLPPQNSTAPAPTINLNFYQTLLNVSMPLKPLPATLSAFRPALTPTARADFLRLLNIFLRVVNRTRVTYFMYGGTLIGSWRHHGFIPWDDDIDLIIDYESRDRIVKPLEMAGCRVHRGAERWKVFWPDRPLIKHSSWAFPFLDISFYKTVQSRGKEDDKATKWLVDSDAGYASRFSYRYEWVFPLHQRPFEGQLMWAPADTSSVIGRTYDAGKCVPSSYNHRDEHFIKHVARTIDCAELEEYYPFVKRTPVTVSKSRGIIYNGSKKLVNETLSYPNQVISWFVEGV